MDIIERLERRDETAIELLKACYGDYCYRIIHGVILLALTVLFAQGIALLSKKTGSTTATLLLSLLWIPVLLALLM